MRGDSPWAAARRKVKQLYENVFCSKWKEMERVEDSRGVRMREKCDAGRRRCGYLIYRKMQWKDLEKLEHGNRPIDLFFPVFVHSFLSLFLSVDLSGRLPQPSTAAYSCRD